MLILTYLDLNKNELRNAVIQNLPSAPSTPSEGQIYYNSTDDQLYVYSNSTWVNLMNSSGLSNAYATITDGTTAANASGGDTFKLRSADNKLTIATQNNDGTHGDNALFTINQGNIDHNSLTNYDANGVIQTVTKIKQTITLPAGVLTAFGFLINLDTLASKNITSVFPGFAGQINSSGDFGTVFFLSALPGFSTLTAFANGKGYVAIPTTDYTITFYEAPLNTGYHVGLVNGLNYVVHNSDTTTSANATSWIGLTITSVDTYTGGTLVVNPTTWTKGQAYIVTTSTGPQAAIGSPTTPIPVDRSNGALGQVLVPNTDGDAVWGTPSWTTATRPTPLTGQYPSGFNITTSKHEGWNGSTWNNFY